MQAKYNAAIKAGVIGGLVLAAYAVLQVVIGILPGVNVLTTVCGCLLIPFVIAIAVVTGALAVKYGAGAITRWADALVAAAVAGAIAGVIYGVVIVVVAFVSPLLNISSYTDTTDIGAELASNLGVSAIAGTATCLCAVVWLVAIIILAVIGGAIWGALKLKLS